MKPVLGATVAARACGAALACLGLLVLVVGWWAGVEPLRSIGPGLTTMKALTSLAFILVGSSLVLLTFEAPAARRTGVLLGGLTAIMGGAVIGEYLWGGLGFDQLLAHDPASSAWPGRPSPLVAVVLLFAGLALAMIDVERPRRPHPFAVFLVALAATTALGGVGYLYGVDYLHGDARVTGVAVHTMVAMLVLSVGIALARPDQHPVAFVLAATPGAGLFRRLAPGVIMTVFALAYLRELSVRADLVSAEEGTSIFVVAMGTTLVVAIFVASRRLDASIDRDETRFRAVIESAHEAYVAIDDRGSIIEWNRAAESTFGWSRGEALGRELAGLLVPERHRDAHRAGIERFRSTGQARVVGQRLELEALHRDGRELPVELTITAAKADAGQTLSAFIQDISERRQVERRRAQALLSAERAAHTDELTGLPNRRALRDHLVAQIEPEWRRNGAGTSTWVAMLDLDHFKDYNDARGHPAGDRLLREAASAWRAALRESDFLSRYGGEEFIVVLPEITEAGAWQAIERLRAATPHGQTCSAGVVRQQSADGIEDLLGRADRALYDAKEAGRNRAVVVA